MSSRAIASSARPSNIRRSLLAAAAVAVVAVTFAFEAGEVEPAAAAEDPTTTERVNEGHPVFAAVEVSQVRFGPAGGDGTAAAHVVLARSDTFADAIAASGLAGDGPLLYTDGAALHPAVRAEIQRVLAPGGTVFVLGGTAAIADAVLGDLRSIGMSPERLAGASRIETALAVADEVRAQHGGGEVLIARAFGTDTNPTSAWADSIAAGARAAAEGTPIVVTPTEALHPAVGAWLAADGTISATLLGGSAALSEQVAEAVDGAVSRSARVSGAERAATAAAVARDLWQVDDEGLRSFVITNGLDPDGWAFGFAAAGIAADDDAPILLVTDEVPDATAGLVSSCGEPEVDLHVIGDASIVPASLREQLDVVDGLACGPGGSIVYPTDLTAFPECAAVLEHFRTTAAERVGPYGLGGFGFSGGPQPPRTGNDDFGEAPPAAPGEPATGGEGAGGDSDGGSSGTNVQEEGVDEPDIVKTDGATAYVVAAGSLQIVSLGETPVVIGTFALPANGSHELLLSGDRVLVVTRSFGMFVDGPVAFSDAIAPGGPVSTTLSLLDVSDPASPALVSRMVVEGSYLSARMIEGVARIVLQHDSATLPFVYPTTATPEGEQAAAAANRAVVAASTLDDWLPSYVVEQPDGTVAAEGAVVDCDSVHRPPLFSGLGTTAVVSIDLGGSLSPMSSAAVVAAGQTVYASLDRLFVTTGRWDWAPDALDGTMTTEIHGFDIADPAATAYIASGSVPGYALNQFALSASDGHLRIATTTDAPWAADGTQIGESESAVYILREGASGLDEVGAVTGLGLGERIHGVRFFGDVAAVVTFRQIDPLYLIDLSDPTDPRVTGELKIPGYSAYLHRIAGDRLVGVGADADLEGRRVGAQVSLFDIADRSAPRLVDRVVYPGAYSMVEGDHHAFLHWPATELTVVPIEMYSETGESFRGAVGLRSDAASLVEIGRASHADRPPGGSNPGITRSFVAAGALYTISDAGIERSALGTLEELAWAAF